MADTGSLNSYSRLPLWRIAVLGFSLNAVWELVQCGLLYDMWGWLAWDAAVVMIGAILADVVIVLVVVFGAAAIAGAERLNPPNFPGLLALLAVGLPISVILEWIPRSFGWWGYGSRMPTIEVAGQTLGLLPILQVTLLPALSLFVATIQDRRTRN